MDKIEWITNKGRIASVDEGDTLNFVFQYTMIPSGTISLVSG
jgi:hypothetical protein